MAILDQLELSVRTGNVLRRTGTVNTLQDFMALSRKQVLALPHAGVRTWKEIAEIQSAHTPESREEERRRTWAEFADTVAHVNKLMLTTPAYRVCLTGEGLLVAVQSGPHEAAARGRVFSE